MRNNSGNSANRIIYYIQTGVLATEKTQPFNITVKFRAPLDDSSLENSRREINYEAFKIENEMHLLKAGQFEKYAHC